jgi:hypothetical protein
VHKALPQVAAFLRGQLIDELALSVEPERTHDSALQRAELNFIPGEVIEIVPADIERASAG